MWNQSVQSSKRKWAFISINSFDASHYCRCSVVIPLMCETLLSYIVCLLCFWSPRRINNQIKFWRCISSGASPDCDTSNPAFRKMPARCFCSIGMIQMVYSINSVTRLGAMAYYPNQYPARMGPLYFVVVSPGEVCRAGISSSNVMGE